MMYEKSLLKTRSPELVQEIGGLLDRMGRDDLARKVDGFAIGRVGQDRLLGKLSFYAADAAAAYSVELDARGVTIVVDVAADEELVAVHVRPPED
jgi:hypothetical protein